MTKDDLVIGVVQFVDNCLEAQGEILPAVFVHQEGEDGREAVNAIPYKDGSLPVSQQQDLIIGFVRELIKRGEFRGLVMVSEAWASKPVAEGHEGKPVIRPSLDPDRVEQVIAYVRGENKDTALIMWEMEREGGVVRRGKQVDMPKGTTFESWLDDAFNA